jgi:hypothetical protein
MSSVATQSLLSRFINSPAGPKTIHFWAPTMKWVNITWISYHSLLKNHLKQGLVIAGLSDSQKPADQLSLSQNLCNVYM